jgi:hypothetical protein
MSSAALFQPLAIGGLTPLILMFAQPPSIRIGARIAAAIAMPSDPQQLRPRAPARRFVAANAGDQSMRTAAL